MTVRVAAVTIVLVVLVVIVAVAKIKFASAAMLASAAQIAIAQPTKNVVTLANAQPNAATAKITVTNN